MSDDTRLMSSERVAEHMAALDGTPWDERRARRWMARTGAGLRLNNRWVTTMDRIEVALSPNGERRRPAHPIHPKEPETVASRRNEAIMVAKAFTASEVYDLLTAAAVVKPDGGLWSQQDVAIWLKALKNKNGVVSREQLYATFPDVFAALDMPESADSGEFLVALRRGHKRVFGATTTKDAVVSNRVYVFEVPGVFVKFGYSSAIVSRLKGHVDAAELHGRTVSRIWISGGYETTARAVAAESLVKKRLGDREYLRGASFDEVVEVVADVCYRTAAPPGEFVTCLADVEPLLLRQAEADLQRAREIREEVRRERRSK